MKLTIGYLYGELMNIYGDIGNIIALTQRANWREIDVRVKNITVGDKLVPKMCDIFFFGGGQDHQQELVSRDLVSSIKGKALKAEIERGVPLLSVCGGYQLLGDYYQPHEGPKLPGISLFPAYTVAGNKRMIGNIVIHLTSEIRLPTSELVGFENHSGKTYLKEGAKPLGKVISGYGNNGEDKGEGCIYKNAIGCYMHGSLLPKNPHLSDWLLQKALEVKYCKEIQLKPLDDHLELQAHKATIAKLS